MATALPTLVFANLLVMGALPTVLFRRGGGFTLMWWVTAAPFLLCGRVVALARRGELAGWITLPEPLASLAAASVIAACLASLALIAGAWRAHERKPALWHQQDDTPEVLVTSGVYARVRHPLYASYLLVLVAACVAVPHPLTVVSLLSGWLLLEHTARREERRLQASAFATEYAAYMRRTGRFWPACGAAEPR